MLLLLAPGHGRVQAAESPEMLLHRWLASQTNLQSFAADFVQTRTLRSLAQPLTTPGRLYFAAPSSFRWELGTPPQTIALRHTNRLWVIYPAQKRAERYDLQSAGSQWRETFALLEAGFPRSRAELETRYRLENLLITNGVLEVTLIPRQMAARRLIPELRLGVAPEENRLCYTSLKMADGSLMRQDYTNAVVNPTRYDAPFTWTPPPDYQVVEPLQRRSTRP
jgi:outer membrane lipoprotein-sorting protein